MTSAALRYAVYYTFDAKAEERLQSLRRRLAAEVEGVRSVDGKMPPHLTLLVFEDAHPDKVRQCFMQFARASFAHELELDSIDAFRGRQNVLYVAPILSEQLKTDHRHCFNAFSESLAVPQYQNPAQWHPHVTLAKGLPKAAFAEAMALAQQAWRPLTANLHRIGLINVQQPLAVLAEKLLR